MRMRGLSRCGEGPGPSRGGNYGSGLISGGISEQVDGDILGLVTCWLHTLVINIINLREKKGMEEKNT